MAVIDNKCVELWNFNSLIFSSGALGWRNAASGPGLNIISYKEENIKVKQMQMSRRVSLHSRYKVDSGEAPGSNFMDFRDFQLSSSPRRFTV